MLDVKIAVIGCGLWGKNLIRNFYNLGALYSGCDIDHEMLEAMSTEYPGVNFTDNMDNLFNSKEINGIAIATPSHTHYPLVKKAIGAGKLVYVEKPIATNSEEAKELTELAEQNERALMVGHLLLYHPAVNRLRTLIAEGVLGDIVYAQSDRLNVNYYKNDRSVMWDLAPHDLSMISYVLDKSPVSVRSAVGTSTGNDGIIDITHIDIDFPDGILVHISDSWIHPEKRVVLLVRGTKATAILDDAEPINKIRIFDNFSQNNQIIECPEYIEIEPLKLECQHFINCIHNKIKPRSDGMNGYEVVKTLEEAEKIMLGNNYSKIHNLQLASSRRKSKQELL